MLITSSDRAVYISSEIRKSTSRIFLAHLGRTQTTYAPNTSIPPDLKMILRTIIKICGDTL